jgi:hypothetical protein
MESGGVQAQKNAGIAGRLGRQNDCLPASMPVCGFQPAAE